jgi:hypothetical protein
MKIAYVDQAFRPASLDIIDLANEICDDYSEQGYNLTLRQLYYQLVARGHIANSQKEYKRVGSIINDGRMAGLIDWDYITDRTRSLSSLATWSSPESIVRAVAEQYREDRWRDQPEYVEVWVEKEALADVVARAADARQVPYFCCRGYVSQSEMWAAGQRLVEREDRGKKVTIVHLGDHDPSGLDMTRDIRDRLTLFGSYATVRRIALNMDQIEQYQPPPNPAKITDSRAEAYIEEYGPESWELDALDPATLNALITDEIGLHLDLSRWEAATAAQLSRKSLLRRTSERWDDVVSWLRADEDGAS